MDFDKINCRTDCRQCNHKGVPSVMKGSKYCDSIREGYNPRQESSWIDNIVLNLRLKGMMRGTGKTKEPEDKGVINETPQMSKLREKN